MTQYVLHIPVGIDIMVPDERGLGISIRGAIADDVFEDDDSNNQENLAFIIKEAVEYYLSDISRYINIPVRVYLDDPEISEQGQE
jgi:hypothetical protein